MNSKSLLNVILAGKNSLPSCRSVLMVSQMHLFTPESKHPWEQKPLRATTPEMGVSEWVIVSGVMISHLWALQACSFVCFLWFQNGPKSYQFSKASICLQTLGKWSLSKPRRVHCVRRKILIPKTSPLLWWGWWDISVFILENKYLWVALFIKTNRNLWYDTSLTGCIGGP